MKIKFKHFVLNVINYIDYLLRIPIFYYHLYFNNTVRRQKDNVYNIPVIIINYNQLYYLQKNVNRLLELGFLNIVIIDNASSFEPLQKYYEELKKHKNIVIEALDENLGHLVLFKRKELFNKYCKGYYILSDADIILNEKCTDDFVSMMINILVKKHFFFNQNRRCIKYL